MKQLFIKRSSSEEELEKIGEWVSQVYAKSIRLFLLRGDLGAGKTTFVRGFGRGMNITTRVTSPTFSLIEEHPIPHSKKQLIHVDVYRITSEKDLYALGIEDVLLDPKTITLVEWADKFKNVFAQHTPRLEITFVDLGADKREISGKVISRP